MRPIPSHTGQKTLLIPAMLDDHFPLLQYAFYSKACRPVILDNEQGIADLGLRYAHNDMCYPFHLIVGQMIAALRSGEYDPAQTCLLMPTVGDACRGSNFASLLRKAVAAAGFPQTAVLTLNTKGIEKDWAMKIEPGMVWRALFALYWGDLLMLLTDQTRPYEREPGAAETCRAKWNGQLAQDLREGKNLTLRRLRQTFRQITADFAALPKTGQAKPQAALVGELYTKYCHMGNWNMRAFLEESGWEVRVNGLSWYVLYYIDNQIEASHGSVKGLWRAGGRLLAGLQRDMVNALRAHGFHALPAFPEFKEEAARYFKLGAQVADGWLIGAEIAGHVRQGCDKILALQPFGCLPSHICGRGMYAALSRKLGGGKIVSVDLDASASPAGVYNRAALLLDGSVQTKTEKN